MELTKRKSAHTRSSDFCHLSDNSDFVEVTDWTNGEGYDIIVSRKNSEQRFSITSGELEAINFLCTVLDFNLKIKKDD